MSTNRRDFIKGTAWMGAAAALAGAGCKSNKICAVNCFCFYFSGCFGKKHISFLNSVNTKNVTFFFKESCSFNCSLSIGMSLCICDFSYRSYVISCCLFLRCYISLKLVILCKSFSNTGIKKTKIINVSLSLFKTFYLGSIIGSYFSIFNDFNEFVRICSFCKNEIFIINA